MASPQITYSWSSPPLASTFSAAPNHHPQHSSRFVDQPVVHIDASVLNDRMSTIDLSALTVSTTTPRMRATSAPFESALSRWQKAQQQVDATLGVLPAEGGGGMFQGRGWCESDAHGLLGGSKAGSDGASFLQAPMAETADYTLSSNPPNPKTSFRQGDWICVSQKCAAHNFGRNLTCIGCGSPRSVNSLHVPSSPSQPSPRFHPVTTYYSSGPPPPFHRPPIGPPSPALSSSSPVGPPNKPAHPLLTPSGRAFAVGGKVQNVSNDPLNPCIMYWPDNEPFPEQGQIRPNGMVGIPQPPILNTGNRGPISHQPGDWVCQKCNYLNWRRRKVCQTCLPYAEGNGDSISAAVQSERIALLTNVLAHTRIDGGTNLPQQPTPRSHSLTPPQAHDRRPFIDISPPSHPHLHPSSHAHHAQNNKPVHRSQSHFALGQHYSQPQPGYLAASPIYQTPPQPQQRQPSPLLYSTGPDIAALRRRGGGLSPGPASVVVGNGSAIGGITGAGGGGQLQPRVYYHQLQVQAPAPAPLLPSFLQDMVQSPALSPTSTTTSSAELSSVEEYDDLVSPTSSQNHKTQRASPTDSMDSTMRVSPMFPRARGDSGSSSSGTSGSSSSLLGESIANIWRMDGAETKSISNGFVLNTGASLSLPLPLPVPVGAERKRSRAGL